MEIDLAPHPNFAGQLSMLTPPPPEMERTQAKGGSWTTLRSPSEERTSLHVWVERRVTGRVPLWKEQPSKKPRGRTP